MHDIVSLGGTIRDGTEPLGATGELAIDGERIGAVSAAER